MENGSRCICDISRRTYIHVFFSQSVSMAKLNSKFLEGICDLMGENPTKSQAMWFSSSSLVFHSCAVQRKLLNLCKLIWIRE